MLRLLKTRFRIKRDPSSSSVQAHHPDRALSCHAHSFSFPCPFWMQLCASSSCPAATSARPEPCPPAHQDQDPSTLSGLLALHSPSGGSRPAFPHLPFPMSWCPRRCHLTPSQSNGRLASERPGRLSHHAFAVVTSSPLLIHFMCHVFVAMCLLLLTPFQILSSPADRATITGRITVMHGVMC